MLPELATLFACAHEGTLEHLRQRLAVAFAFVSFHFFTLLLRFEIQCSNDDPALSAGDVEKPLIQRLKIDVPAIHVRRDGVRILSNECRVFRHHLLRLAVGFEERTGIDFVVGICRRLTLDGCELFKAAHALDSGPESGIERAGANELLPLLYLHFFCGVRIKSSRISFRLVEFLPRIVVQVELITRGNFQRLFFVGSRQQRNVGVLHLVPFWIIRTAQWLIINLVHASKHVGKRLFI